MGQSQRLISLLLLMLLPQAAFHCVLGRTSGNVASFKAGNLDLESNEPCQPLLFVFGASMADTGEYSSAMPYLSRADFPPYGVDYFSHPAGRWSNGRVFTDFITQGLGYGFLNPFLSSVHSNFSIGANFACAGSTARMLNDTHLFPLGVQVNQFKKLLADLLITNQSSSQNQGYSEQQIRDAIYLFETASNDYMYQLENTTDFDQEALVLDILNSMEAAFRDMYKLGARNYLVMTLTPVGCTPSFIASYSSSYEADDYGCITFFNDICELHNRYLERLLGNLTVELPDANWILFDAYSIFLDGYHNPSRYGIKYPFKACCGAGGEQNYVNGIPCGSNGYVNGTYVEATECIDPSLYLNWDGLHPIESFARYMAEGVLIGNYLRPTFNITSTCSRVSYIA